MSVLALSGVSRAFGGVWAVDGVDLEVAAGRVTGLIGPNGAGKTTLINLITGVLKLSRGRISLDGEDISRLEAADVARRGINRTFQNVRLLPEASVLENILVGFHRHERSSLFANLLNLPAAARERRTLIERARLLLARFGMESVAALPAGSLSYGHQRRVEIMRACAAEPLVLLLDEPVAGMNDVEARELAAIFSSLAEQGMALLLIEHNMRFVMNLCQHICVLDSGHLIAEGSPEAVRGDPAVIAAYLGSEQASRAPRVA
jgi:branched-chain amino acid transport system ATP-binding protein